MSLQWFRPPAQPNLPLNELLETLDPIGVRWQHDYRGPEVHYKFVDGELVAEIGAITFAPKSGLIKVWPARGIGAGEQRVMVGCAQLAFEKMPAAKDGWEYSRKGGLARWTSFILVAVEDEQIGDMIARHHAAMRWSLERSVDRSVLEVVDQ